MSLQDKHSALPGTLLPVLGKFLPEARESARVQQGSIALALAQLAGCRLQDIPALVEAQLNVPFHTLDAMRQAGVSFDVLSYTDCAMRTIYPLPAEHGACRYVVPDPWDDDLFQWLVHRTGSYPELVLAERSEIRQALEEAGHRIRASSDLCTGATSTGAAAGVELVPVISIATIERTHSPVVRFVDAAIYDAWKSGASDIHFECGRQGMHAKLRLDGVLVPGASLDDRALAEEVISRIKVLAQLDIAERRVPQDGRFQMRLAERELDFRVSIMPSIHGEDAVVRLLDKSHLRDGADGISLASLGMDEDAVTRIRAMARRPHGMLLVTGPTGSGKTTTLYAALSEIQTGSEKIITIEDPVEYELPGVLQIPVNEKKGLTFSQGLRSILRHDPDKILVGEIRDSETAEIAVQAALTGHLVFTTVHANSVYDVISRFVHMEIDLYSLLSALNGVVAQRLIRRICPSCRVPVEMSEALAQRLQSAGMRDVTPRLMRGQGCESCRQTGYKGRYAIAEVLPLDDALRAMIMRRADVMDIKARAMELGVRPLLLRALDLLVAGRTTPEEVDRVVAHD